MVKEGVERSETYRLSETPAVSRATYFSFSFCNLEYPIRAAPPKSGQIFLCVCIASASPQAPPPVPKYQPFWVAAGIQTF